MAPPRTPTARAWRLGAIALSCLLLALALAAAVLNYLELNSDLALLFHADSDYLPALYRDLVEQGGSLRHWRLTPAPSFFPDWPLFFLAHAAAGDFFHALPLFFVLQGLLLFGLVLALLRAHASGPLATVAAAWAVVTVLALAMRGMVPYNYFYVSAFHCGVFLLLLLSLRWQHDGAWRLLAGVALLATLSDRLYLLQYVLPTLVLLGWWGWRAGAPWLRPAVHVLLGALAGVLLYKVKWLVAHPVLLPWAVSRDALHANLPALRAMLDETWHGSPAAALALAAYYAVLTVLLPGTLLQRGWRIADPGLARLALFNWVSVAGGLAAVMISNQLFTVRYFIPAYLLPLVIGPLLLSASLAPRWRRALGALLLAAMAWQTQAMLRPAVSGLGAVQRAYYPPEVACLDGVIAQYGLQRGVATYWDAKPASMLSRHRPQIAAYQPSLEAFRWITSDAVFDGAYDFALVRHVEGLDVGRIIALNGAPAARVECGLYEVVVYPRGALRHGFTR